MLRLLSKKDQEPVIEYLLENEIETIFLYGNIMTNGLENDISKRRCGDYYGYFKDDKIIGIIAFYNLGSCIPHYVDKVAEIPFVGLMMGRSFDIVLGMKKVVYPLIEKLRETKEEKSIDEDMYMVNNDLNPFTLENGICIDIDTENETHVEFSMAIANECFGEQRTLDLQRIILSQKDTEEDHILYTLNDSLAAQAVIHCYTKSYGQIGGVGTCSEFRNKGAAKNVVSQICKRIITKGKIPTLMVRKNNAPAVKVYEALGFKKYDDYIMVYY